MYANLVVDADGAERGGNRVQHVIPGDLMYYGDGDPEVLEHLAIVQSVTYDENGFASISAIRLIESTRGYEEGIQSVINERRIGLYERDRTANWRLVRLRPQ